MPAKSTAAKKTRKTAPAVKVGKTPPRFKVPYKPFWTRIGGVDVLVRPSKDKGTIPDEVIERAFEAVFGQKEKAR